MPLGMKASAAPGKPDDSSAPIAKAAIERAVALVQASDAAAVVTNPIAKSVMQASGFAFPGHTEFLAHLAVRADAKPLLPVMLIWSDALAVVPVTIHVPFKDVARLLTAELIVETGRIVAREFVRRFGIARPRLALCGLNPHAGEQGTLGHEDEDIVRPAVERLKVEGIDASGPWSADTLFHAGARQRYDVVLGMYHDQVLIPAKTLAFDRAVNVTLGLPFVRTSPDHGTAFDLAGSGKANPSSLLAALKLAVRLAKADAPAPAR
jgi:4-hydroxythreonine-4-phosphate dehydrogenase